jgi:hypothetical protein
LGQGLFFGAFFIVLGWLMRYWAEGGTAPNLGGRIAMIAGAILVIWGVLAFYQARGKDGAS